jgi:hypothetical protein
MPSHHGFGAATDGFTFLRVRRPLQVARTPFAGFSVIGGSLGAKIFLAVLNCLYSTNRQLLRGRRRFFLAPAFPPCPLCSEGPQRRVHRGALCALCWSPGWHGGRREHLFGCGQTPRWVSAWGGTEGAETLVLVAALPRRKVSTHNWIVQSRSASSPSGRKTAAAPYTPTFFWSFAETKGTFAAKSRFIVY